MNKDFEIKKRIKQSYKEVQNLTLHIMSMVMIKMKKVIIKYGFI